MEKRRIVRSGNTSFTIAIPISWIRKNRLNKGDELNISENELGEILLSYGNKEIRANKTVKTIKVDNKQDEEINIELLDAYIKDYPTIILEGDKIGKNLENLTKDIKKFIGLDIIEQTSDSIVIKNFSTLDNETSSSILLKKMDLGIRAMFDMLSSFFKSGFSKEDFIELKKIKEQNERMYILTRKTILKIIENPHLLKKFKTSYHQISKEKVISASFNHIASVILSLGKAFLYLEHKKKDILILKNIFNTIVEEYLTVLNSFRHKTSEDAFKFLNKHNKNYRLWESYLKETKNPLILESITHALCINDLLHQIAFEIRE